jgi:hypothetical protein
MNIQSTQQESNSKKKQTKKTFKKKQVSFSTQEVFDVGFKPDVETCFCNVSRMLFKNVINIDGSIDMEQLVNVRKKELWAYIYYLYQYNNSTIPEFIRMKNPVSGKADGQLFHDTVYDDKDFKNSNTNTSTNTKTIGTDIVRLVYFINKMIHTYKTDLVNPVIDYLKQLMKKEMLTKLSEIKVQMVPTLNSGKNNVKVGVELVKQ